MAKREASFDERYFRKFYKDPRSRVVDPGRVRHLGEGISGMVLWLGGPLRNVLEVGAGAGALRDWFREAHPGVRYVSTDASPYACESFGHTHRDIATWRGRERFDLVICQGVLPYLPKPACEAAMENLAAMSRGFLYLEAVTKRDLRDVCDPRTDADMFGHAAAFYRRALGKHFRRVGGGLYYVRKGPLVFYELEAEA